MGAFPGLLVDGFPFDEEGLSDMGKVEVVVEFGRSPDLAGFDPAMVGRGDFDEVRLCSIVEEQDEILIQGGLVAFHRKMVMRLAFVDEVGGQLALSMQSIGSD